MAAPAVPGRGGGAVTSTLKISSLTLVKILRLHFWLGRLSGVNMYIVYLTPYILLYLTKLLLEPRQSVVHHVR